MRKFLYAVLVPLAALFAVIPAGSYAAEKGDPLSAILKMQAKVNLELARMDAETASAARQIQATGQSEENIRKILRKLAKSIGYCVDASFVDAAGVMKIVEPQEYRKFEGADISKQTQVIKLRKDLTPVMGDVFMSAEGFYAAAIEYPVFSGSGKLLGSVSMMFVPEKFFASVLSREEKAERSGIHVWVMQTDGRDLYDDNKGDIGSNIITGEAYKQFPTVTDFARKVAAEQSGVGSYDFYDIGTRDVVKKKAAWTTVGIHGTQWRLILTLKEPLPSGNAVNDASITAATQAAASMLQGVYDKYKAGEFTLEQAKKLGADLLRQLRYGDGGREYFWADTTDGVNVVHAIDKSLEGKSRIDANINGVYYIRELISNGRNTGGGFTVYWFPKPGEKTPAKKRAYTTLFKPFGWIIGTGYYLE